MKLTKLLTVLLVISLTLLISCQKQEKMDNGERVNEGETVVDDKKQPPIDNDSEKEKDKNNQEDKLEQESDKNGQESTDEEETEESKEVAQHIEKIDEFGLVIVSNPESVEVFVNKQRRLPDGYEPPNLVVPNVPFSFDYFDPKKQMRSVAATPLEELFLEAEAAGLDLVASSGYRSFQRQKQIYERNVETKGQEEADKFSARPGTSEHQTGLAMDVTTAEVAFALEQTFKQTDEGAWLAENAHKFGFIIRYPEGDSEITGYSYEPWHIRYVGMDIAKEVYLNQMTLEEYFGYGY
ncbi:M15 family metallopeptidase [Aquibacillus saliphilus]|uniref:M15 family metallopeptidase n=1 Tax=Aquibacillus saliphilus TaxID=1909422 RepID=UPI001CF0A0BF|nr:M15 family metallopeptidase [Aquibacillus saliphilus]